MVNAKKQNFDGMLAKIYIAILLIVFGGIVLHAPISVGLGTIWPDYSLLIKSWKEILMLIAGLIALFLICKNKQMKILRDPVIIAIAAYAVLHLVLLFYLNQGLAASVAGLAIDLRYILFFGLVYIAMKLYPEYRKMFIRVGIAGALIVLIFALLQVLILPNDILKYIGYNVNTISPYLTVDKNNAFIRINSTLRGPNPLGAYAGLVLVLIVAAIAKSKITKDKWSLAVAGILSAGGVVALWASYSRSALIGTIVAIILVLAVVYWRKLSTRMWITISIILIVLAGGLFAIRDTSFISNVVLHENPTGGSSINSNEGHANSLSDGTMQLLSQPLGAGIGSTGSASLLGSKSEIIENQYLFVAHEIGWLGLAIFVFIFASIQIRLWKLRNNWLALGVFASGIGLALVGILLPVWVDDTVAIIWWGLAAVALFPPRKNEDL
jgi:hypothetical protein